MERERWEARNLELTKGGISPAAGYLQSTGRRKQGGVWRTKRQQRSFGTKERVGRVSSGVVDFTMIENEMRGGGGCKSVSGGEEGIR